MDTSLSRKSRSASSISIKKTDLSRSTLRIILASCMALSILLTSPLAWATDSKNPSNHRLINQQRVQDMKDQAAELRERLKDHQRHRGGGPELSRSVAGQSRFLGKQPHRTSQRGCHHSHEPSSCASSDLCATSKSRYIGNQTDEWRGAFRS